MAEHPALLTVCFLHPGAMGSVLAGTCNASSRLWVGEGRSGATQLRAEAAGLIDAGSLSALAERADAIISICPPAEAVSVAEQVAATGFEGVYVDANAISPERARSIGELLPNVVDASVIGLPPTTAGTTRLYVSGPDGLTAGVQDLWADSLFEVVSVGESIGAASSLKMAYAGWTKGSMALLLSMAALAEAEGVSGALRDEWSRSIPELLPRLDAGAPGVAPKAWRFHGEMEEIAATMEAAGLPAEFHLGAADVYRRLASFKGVTGSSVAEVLDNLLDRPEAE